MKKLDTSLARGLREDGRAVPRALRRRRHRPVRRRAAAAERPLAAGLRRAEVHRLRGRAGRLPRRHRLRHPARAQGHQGRARSGRWSSASTAWRAGRSDVADPKVNNPAYNQFAVRLAERGFITFAPQNLYIFQDRFRTLQRKANPLEQDALLGHRAPAPADHRLAQDAAVRRPGADRLLRPELRRQDGHADPAAGDDYCLSICSADFNEWVWKNASTRSPYSYVWTRRVRDLRVRPGQHVQLRRDGGPDRAAAVHGRARPLRRRRARRDGRPTSSPRSAASTRPSSSIGDRCRDRVLRRPAHDPRRRDVRLPAQTFSIEIGHQCTGNLCPIGASRST